MSDYTEMRQRSLTFRRISSNLLQSDSDNADVNLVRFAKFIDEDPYIHKLIHEKIDSVEFDFTDCFPVNQVNGWRETCIPEDEVCHLKAQYDYIQYILPLNGDRVLGQAMHYLWGSRKYDDMVQDFLEMAFKPMINYITDAMSMELIMMEENKQSTATMNINTVNGNAFMQTGSGTINATTNISTQATELVALIDRILPELDNIKDAPPEEIESVKDDLESLKEQALAENPKPSRMKKAVAGIKKFGRDVMVKLLVSLASNAILKTDWPALEQQATAFISGFLP